MTDRIRYTAAHARRAAVGLLVVTALATALAVRHVSRRREVMRLGYELSAATAQLRHAQEENRRLRLEKSVLTQPDRIEALAAGLGMIRPGPEQIRAVGQTAAPPPPPLPAVEAP